MNTDLPPLILGADGRLGRAFRTLCAGGMWPGGTRPVWHARRPGLDLAWDMAGPAPELPPVRGVICLAGRTAGTESELKVNTTAALAALDLAEERGLGPVLLFSSAAVYGAGPGPHREDGPATPANAYGIAKLDMERAVTGHGTCLRLANVAGSDALFGAMSRGPVTLDRFPDGAAPRRAYMGPLTLARALLALLELPDLPAILNLTQPGTLGMDAVLEAAGHPFQWTPAPDTALPEMSLSTDLLETFLPLPPATADTLVAEARAAGWSAAP